ncbi:MAG: isochorismatase family protein [Pseudomonadota bacterium]
MLINANDVSLAIIDVQEKLLPTIPTRNQLTQNLNFLICLAKALNIPTLLSEQYPLGLGETVATIKQQLPNQHSHIVKTAFSCVKANNFNSVIKQHKSKQFILAGIEAHVCVLQTAFELKQLGKQVYVVVDAIASRNEIDKNIALQRMQTHGIELVTKEMILFECLRDSKHEKFKQLNEQLMKKNTMEIQDG